MFVLSFLSWLIWNAEAMGVPPSILNNTLDFNLDVTQTVNASTVNLIGLSVEDYRIGLKLKYPNEIYLSEAQVQFCQTCLANQKILFAYPMKTRPFHQGLYYLCMEMASKDRHLLVPYVVNYIVNDFHCRDPFYARKYNASDLSLYYRNGSRMLFGVYQQRFPTVHLGMDDSVPPVINETDWATDRKNYLSLGKLRNFVMAFQPSMTFQETLETLKCLPIVNTVYHLVKWFST